MKIIKPTNLGLLPRPFTFGAENVLCVSAYAFFTFDHGRTVLEENAMWEALKNTLLENEIFDTGEPKPQAEYLVYGRCHPKDNARAARVRVRAGDLEKTLEIYGNRRWSLGIPGDPAKLNPLRICWQHAYGGFGHPSNPLGKGFALNADGTTALPNILDPHISAEPENSEQHPAGLTAYPLDSPLRTRYYGKFDKDWLRNHWPALPAGTKPEIFMTAPKDQWFSGFLQGNETIFLEGMHPQQRFQETKLPGLRARIFAQKQGETPESFVEGEARADTLWLLPEDELAILCYRAQIPTCDDEASDITHLLAVWENQDEPPQTSAFYRAFLDRQLAPEEAAAVETAPEQDPAPQPPVEKREAEPPEAAEDAPEIAALKQETAQIEAQTRALQQKHGLSDADLKKRLPPEPVADDTVMTAADLQKATAQIEAESKRMLQERGLTIQDVERMAKERSGTGRPFDLKAAMKQMLENDKLPAEEKSKLSGALAAFLEAEKALAAHEAELAAAATAAPSPPAADEPPEEKAQGFAGRDLSGEDFSGRVLRDTDFSNAVLSGCNFNEADCARADFSNAVLDQADFSNARCEHARFVRVSAPGALFRSANLLQAVLSDGDFSECDFSSAKLREADISHTLFLKARMWDLAASQLTASHTDFTEADLTGSDLSESFLEAADFSSAKIGSVQFTRAKAHEARFFGATGSQVRFESADLLDSRADGTTDLPEAGFSHARLLDAKWGGARLQGCKCIHTDMDRADFSQSDFSRGTFNGISARHADFSKAIFSAAHLQHANLFYASFRKADLTGATIRHSNLFGADLYKIRLDKDALHTKRMSDLNLKRTLLDPALFSD